MRLVLDTDVFIWVVIDSKLPPSTSRTLGHAR